MKKSNLKYVVDLAMFLCVTGVAGIGILMGFFLAEGPTVREQDKYFLSLHRHQWGEIHLCLSVVFTFLIILHLFLNWKWVKCKTRDLFRSGWKIVLIAAAVLALLIPLIFWAFFPKYPPEYFDYGRGGRRSLGTVPSQIQPQDDPARKEEPPRQEESARPLSERPRGNAQTPPRDEEAEHKEMLVHGRLETGPEGIVLHGQMTMQDVISQTGIPYEKIAAALDLPYRIPLQESLGRLRRRYGFTMVELRDTIEKIIKEQKQTTR
ncbi:MAG: DUF4405 domain-containing protein [Candidatus Aminicenantes bacterium]